MWKENLPVGVLDRDGLQGLLRLGFSLTPHRLPGQQLVEVMIGEEIVVAMGFER